MNKRPLLILSGTVMGTVGILSYVPAATNAMAPLGTTSTLATSAQASAPVAATAPQSKAATTTASGAASKAARVAKTLKKKTATKAATKSAAKAAGTAAAPVVSTATRTIAGSTVQTNFGPVQVQITVKGTQIVSATALQTPRGGRSSSINSQAVPYLIQQTLAAQSATIAGVGGATYTSDGWVQSLQAAIAKI
jgi:uncharacterized protein with FMN-binding domain